MAENALRYFVLVSGPSPLSVEQENFGDFELSNTSRGSWLYAIPMAFELS
jgi:hypothetical protein